MRLRQPVKRAVAWELVTAFAFLSLVAVHAETERTDGWATRLIHGWLDPDRVPPCLGGVALLLLSVRWLAWTRDHQGVVDLGMRARALGGALVGLAVAALTCWWLVGTKNELQWYALCPELSRELLRYEALGFAFVAVGLATAPAGVLAGLARRPVHAVLVGATLSLGSYCFLNWGCRAPDVGWGRAVLLGTGVGLGLALGASRLSASPSRSSVSVDSGGRWVLVALVASIGWPGRVWWFEDAIRSVLGRLEIGEAVACLSDLWILQTVLACHLASAWRLPRRRVVEVALCAGVALQLTFLVALLTPARVASALAPGALIVAPAEAFVLTTWGLLTLGALWLRVTRPRTAASGWPDVTVPDPPKFEHQVGRAARRADMNVRPRHGTRDVGARRVAESSSSQRTSDARSLCTGPRPPFSAGGGPSTGSRRTCRRAQHIGARSRTHGGRSARSTVATDRRVPRDPERGRLRRGRRGPTR